MTSGHPTQAHLQMAIIVSAHCWNDWVLYDDAWLNKLSHQEIREVKFPLVPLHPQEDAFTQ